jgi:hypothetical protein
MLQTRRTDTGWQTDWAFERSIVACGVRVGIRINKPAFVDRVLPLIPDIWKPSSSSRVERVFSLTFGASGLRHNGRSPHRLFEDQRLLTESGNLDWVLRTFERSLKSYLAEMARQRVFVHAGVVGWLGKAILVPGRSFTGKTSLVAELVRAGAIYYSDEYAVLDSHGRVHPYTAPLGLREDATLKQRPYQPEDFGGSTGVKPLKAGLIVFSQYKSGAHWHPRQLTSGEAVLELLNNTIPARRKPETVLRTLRQTVTDAIGLKGRRGEAKDVAPLILSRFTLQT